MKTKMEIEKIVKLSNHTNEDGKKHHLFQKKVLLHPRKKFKGATKSCKMC